MKKTALILGSLLRLALLLMPGAALGLWAWPRTTPLIATLAAVGLETIFLFIFAFISVAVQARRDFRRKIATAAAPPARGE